MVFHSLNPSSFFPLKGNEVKTENNTGKNTLTHRKGGEADKDLISTFYS